MDLDRFNLSCDELFGIFEKIGFISIINDTEVMVVVAHDDVEYVMKRIERVL